MIESALHQLITSDQDFFSIAEDRLYPVLLPDDPKLPAVTYQRITTRRDYTTTGPVGLNRIRMQFDIWASTYAEVKKLQAIILSLLEDAPTYAGVFPDDTRIDSIQLDMATDGYNSDSRLYRVSMDFIVFAAE